MTFRRGKESQGKLRIGFMEKLWEGNEKTFRKGTNQNAAADHGTGSIRAE